MIPKRSARPARIFSQILELKNPGFIRKRAGCSHVVQRYTVRLRGPRYSNSVQQDKWSDPCNPTQLVEQQYGQPAPADQQAAYQQQQYAQYGPPAGYAAAPGAAPGAAPDYAAYADAEAAYAAYAAGGQASAQPPAAPEPGA